MTAPKTTQELQISRIKFPEIKLKTRDAHKLRGYFGTLFKEHSPLLHNHYEDGTFRYKYPVVQYKIIDDIPTLVGIEEGANLLTDLFLKIKELDIDGRKYIIRSKNIESSQEEIGYCTTLKKYKFNTLWMALNQKNYPLYQDLKNPQDRQDMLNRILVGNILSLFRNCGVELKSGERLMTNATVREHQTNFKDQKMIAFAGGFVANATLPSSVGLGKAVSRGFGTVERL